MGLHEAVFFCNNPFRIKNLTDEGRTIPCGHTVDKIRPAYTPFERELYTRIPIRRSCLGILDHVDGLERGPDQFPRSRH